MAKFELKLPKMGESVAEATITSWLKEVGDTIEADEPVLEIATDKVDSEVPSEVDGKLIEILFEADDVVEVGQTIAIIETDGDVEQEDDLDLDLEDDEDEKSTTEKEQHVAEAEAAAKAKAKAKCKAQAKGKSKAKAFFNIAATIGKEGT